MGKWSPRPAPSSVNQRVMSRHRRWCMMVLTKALVSGVEVADFSDLAWSEQLRLAARMRRELSLQCNWSDLPDLSRIFWLWGFCSERMAMGWAGLFSWELALLGAESWALTLHLEPSCRLTAQALLEAVPAREAGFQARPGHMMTRCRAWLHRFQFPPKCDVHIYLSTDWFGLYALTPLPQAGLCRGLCLIAAVAGMLGLFGKKPWRLKGGAMPKAFQYQGRRHECEPLWHLRWSSAFSRCCPFLRGAKSCPCTTVYRVLTCWHDACISTRLSQWRFQGSGG